MSDINRLTTSKPIDCAGAWLIKCMRKNEKEDVCDLNCRECTIMAEAINRLAIYENREASKNM